LSNARQRVNGFGLVGNLELGKLVKHQHPKPKPSRQIRGKSRESLMGGNLFKLGRKPRLEYLEIEAEIRAYLDQKIGGTYRIPRFYGDKPDFGDLDILISDTVANESWHNLRLEITKDLGITQFKAVGHVFSTVYRDLQVDFFVTPQQYLESCSRFMSFNDLGNLLGKICRRFNLKYGEHGLAYVYRRSDNPHYKQDLEISTDFARICEFLGLEFDVWRRGFESLEVMFEWVIASPYFSVAPYQQMDATLKKREQQRSTMQKFVEYLERHSITKTFDFQARDSYLEMIDAFFPEANLKTQIQLEQDKETRALSFAQKFNGKLVGSLLPQLEGKTLGAFIVGFKNSIQDFEDFVLEQDQHAINEQILEFAKTFKV
jgi:hypothetical protein